MRLYWIGTMAAYVTRFCCASCRNLPASNFSIKTTQPPRAKDGKATIRVMFEYIGVAANATDVVASPLPTC